MPAPYATISDVETAIGADTLLALADHNGDRVRDDAVVQAALADASALAESYLDNELPVSDPPPAALRRAVVHIAVHFLRQPRSASTDASREDYRDAMKWLEAISTGKATLSPGQPDVTPPADVLDPGDPEADGLQRIWSRESARRVF